MNDLSHRRRPSLQENPTYSEIDQGPIPFPILSELVLCTAGSWHRNSPVPARLSGSRDATCLRRVERESHVFLDAARGVAVAPCSNGKVKRNYLKLQISLSNEYRPFRKFRCFYVDTATDGNLTARTNCPRASILPIKCASQREV